MKVYIDLILLLNYYLDFLILLTTSIVLKRNTSLKRIALGALLGSFTMIFLFVPVSQIILFLYKVIMAIFMVVVAFHYENMKYTFYNFIYFYMVSIILGGFLYYLNIEFRYTSLGLFLMAHHININVLLLIFASPIIFWIYIHQERRMKKNYSLSYTIKIVLKNKKEYILNAFLDTGNCLFDPITNKPIILLEKGVVEEGSYSFYYVPFHSLNNQNLLKCFRPQYIEIENKKYNNYLIGISDKKFNFDGIKCILNNKLMEDL